MDTIHHCYLVGSSKISRVSWLVLELGLGLVSPINSMYCRLLSNVWDVLAAITMAVYDCR